MLFAKHKRVCVSVSFKDFDKGKKKTPEFFSPKKGGKKLRRFAAGSGENPLPDKENPKIFARRFAAGDFSFFFPKKGEKKTPFPQNDPIWKMQKGEKNSK